MTVTKESVEARPSRGPLLLSGLVFPGLGQCMQRRWLAAGLFGVGFTVLFCMVLVRSFQVIIAFYRMGLEGSSPENVPAMGPVFVWFGLSIAVYIANIIDAYLAHRRAARRSALHRHLDPTLAAMLEEQDKTTRSKVS